MADFEEKLLSVLKHCHEHGEIIGIHLWEDDPTSFIVGYVLGIGEESFTLEEIDATATTASITELELERVGRFHVGSAYLRRVETLYRHRGEIYKPTEPLPQFTIGSLYRETLRLAMQRKWVVTIKDEKRHRMEGFVTEVGDDFVGIEFLAEDGTADGTFAVCMSDIAYLSVHGRDEQALAFLHQHALGR